MASKSFGSRDAFHKAQVSIAPSLGNNAYEFLVNGKNVMWFPQRSLADFKAKPTFSGNPLLAPWANRLDHDGFYANGKHYIAEPASEQLSPRWREAADPWVGHLRVRMESDERQRR